MCLIGKSCGILLVGLFSCQTFNGMAESASLFDLAVIETPRVLKKAHPYLQGAPRTVTADHCDRSAGGVHDFYSEGDYWWPNPDDPDGPYIRKDGQTNPGNFIVHRKFHV